MALSSIDIFATIPLATYYMVKDVKRGVRPWISWEDTHSYYSRVIPIPALIWKNDPDEAQVLEMYRWSLVLCAFVFFAFFGFADETRQQYRRVFTSLVRRIGYPTSFGTFSGSSHAYVVQVLLLAHEPTSFQEFVAPSHEEQSRRHGP
jgi:pheromone a factor receptor